MPDRILIQHQFTIGNYTDALNELRTDYDKLTPTQIEAMKQARYDKHLYDLAHPPAEPVVTKAEKLANIAKDKQALQDQLATLSTLELELTGGK